ncbi:hypothetical protein AB3X96_40605, partial [Paraburkholderia sp. BR13439]
SESCGVFTSLYLSHCSTAPRLPLRHHERRRRRKRIIQTRLASGAKLTSVRDNLRHASIATTSMYLHGDEIQRARDMDQAFAARK